MKDRWMALQKDCVYGPIHSRRLGKSLGINLLPVEVKFCNFNCLYCQYGWTDSVKMRRYSFPPASYLVSQIKKYFWALASSEEKIDAITFSGNGEPTLHPEFEMIAYEVRRLRDKIFPQTRLVLFSNASRVYKREIQEALLCFDECHMKFDVGNEATFRAINNPISKNGSWDLIIEGLKSLPHLILQSLFISHPVDNTAGSSFRSWLDLVKTIKPDAVHLYSLDRAPAYAKARPVSRARLLKLAAQVKSIAKVPAKVF